MPTNFHFDNILGGFALDSGQKGDNICVVTREFISSDDGVLFTDRIENLWSTIGKYVPVEFQRKPTKIDNLLILFFKNHSGIVYVNELQLILNVKLKRDVVNGEQATRDDWVKVNNMRFQHKGQEVEIPPDTAFAFLFSIGWRRGLFFDFFSHQQKEELLSNQGELLYNVLGNLFGQVMFQDLYRITDEEWNLFFQQKWFPFIALKSNTINKMISHVKARWLIDDILPEIRKEVVENLMKNKDSWSKHFKGHENILLHAAEKYISEEYISVVAILYTRIEGIMRGLCGQERERISQKKLSEIATTDNDDVLYEYSVLLPGRFRRYLNEVYFEKFDYAVDEYCKNISRNTVAHGLAEQELFSMKAATLAILIVEQLKYCTKL